MSFLLVAASLVALYATYAWWKFGYFTRRGAASVSARSSLGATFAFLLRRLSMPDLVADLYRQLEGHSYGGVFNFLEPVVMVRDPQVVRAVAVTDFDHFTDRVTLIEEDHDRLFGKNLVSLRGARWREMRSVLSPAFSSGKIKGMFLLVSDICAQMVSFLDKEVSAQTSDGSPLSLEMKDFFTRFTNDAIATTAFGAKVNSVADKEDEFYRMGREIATFTPARSLILLGYNIFPRFMKTLGFRVVPEKHERFFRSLVTQSMEVRQREGIVRPDLIHLLMQAQRGELKDEDEDGATTHRIKLDDDDVLSQALTFFSAGFEAVASFLAMASYQLALHQEVQRRLQKDIDEAVKASDGQPPSYERLQAIKYLDMVVSEVLRLYTPAILTNRTCVKDYRLPDTDSDKGFTVTKGTLVWIPLHAIHHDPNNFPDPERFDPERFSDENKRNIKPNTYMPFGVGPRFCIGQRLALLECKIALMFLLWKFDLHVVPKTPVPLQLEEGSFGVIIKGGSWVGVSKRQLY